MRSFLQDLRYGARGLRKSPVISIAAIVSLALGIGANTAIFTLVKAVFLKPVPVADPATLTSVMRTVNADTASSGSNASFYPTSFPNYLDLARRNHTFTATAAETFGAFAVAGEGDPERVSGSYVTSSYFSVLGIQPALGRFFTAQDDHETVAVISYDLWQSRFGGRADVIGHTTRLNARSFEIVGVAPRGFDGMFTFADQQVWIPVSFYGEGETLAGVPRLEHRGMRAFNIYGRLQPGETASRAEAELAPIAQALEQEHPDWNKRRGFHVVPIEQAMLGPNQRSLFVRAGTLMMGAVGLVLLVACANVANLLLARGQSRRREIAMRLSLGATRGRLLRQLLTESLLLAAVGGAAGLLLASWLKRALWSMRPPFLAGAGLDLGTDRTVLLFTGGLAVLTGLAFGLAPALQALRTELVSVTKEHGGRAGRGSRGLLRQGLVGTQVALCLITMTAAGLFLLSLGNALRLDPGYDYDELVIAGADLDSLPYAPDAARVHLRQLLDELAAIPAVERVAAATSAPLSGGPAYRMFPVGGQDAPPEGVYIPFNRVSAGYFETLGVPLLEGRPIDDRDRPGGRRAVVVNQALARRFWPGESPVGHELRWAADDQPWEVVGMAADVALQSLGEPPTPYLYLALDQDWSPQLTFHLRTRAADAVMPALERRLHQLEPDLPVVGISSVRQAMRRSLWAASLGAMLLASFALLALLLAAVGIYGVLAQTVQDRRREVGIRVALGADVPRVVRQLMRQGLQPVIAGLVVGGFASLFALRFTTDLLFDLSARDPRVLVGAGLLLAAVAALACAFPAWRASRIDPCVVLRAE